MRGFLFALCIAALSFNGVAVAGGNVAAKSSGKVAELVGKAMKVGATFVLGAMLACGLTGCDQGRQMASDVMAVKPTMDNPVKFGVIYEDEFSQSWDGVKLAANEINLAGGINGRYLELIPHKIYGKDRPIVARASDVSRAAAHLILYDEVHAIIGANYSSLSEYIDEAVTSEGVPMVAIGSSSSTLTRASEWVFLTSYDNSFQGKVMASHAIKNMGAETAAVLYYREDAYSEGLAGAFGDSLRELGGNVVAHIGYSYSPDKDNDTFAMELNESGIISEVAASMPDAVFMPGFIESAVVAKELRKAGVRAVFLGADGWGLEELIELGGEAVEGAYFADHFSPNASPMFTKSFMDEYGAEPNALGALGYDALRVTAQAAERAGDNLTHETLRDQIEATENYMGAMTILRYDEKRHPVKSVVLFTIENGKKKEVGIVSP